MEKYINNQIETSLPLRILVRPIADPQQDWRPFEIGPGYFRIPAGMTAAIIIQNIHNDTLKVLVEELENVDAIAKLNLSENRNIDNDGVRWLPRMHQISELDLSACGLNNNGLDAIVKMKNVRKLDLSYCTRITDVGIKKLKIMRSLEELNLRGIPRITHAAIKWIERHDLVIKR